MSFFYNKKAPEYAAYKNPEGKTVQKNIDWHKENHTYVFAYGLGTVIIIIGLLTLLGIWSAKIGFIGGLLTFGMSLVTLTFLITTPEVYVNQFGRRFSYAAIWFSLFIGSGKIGFKGCDYDGRRINNCIR